MTDKHLAHRRLVAQYLVDDRQREVVDLVRSFGAMQGQDLPGVLSSVALRTGAGIQPVIDALDSGELVRGYPMRGTVFLCRAADLRWITELCSPAIRRQYLDSYLARGGSVDLVEQVHSALVTAPMTRTALRDLVVDLGHTTDVQMHVYRTVFELLVTNRAVWGPWSEGEQLLADASGRLGPGLDELFDGDRLAATAELASRYFRTHGPATVDDFAWWSKLPKTLIRSALPLLDDDLTVENETCWRTSLPDELADLGRAPARPMLLPGFDEFILGYQDRLFTMTPQVHDEVVPGNRGTFRRPVVVDGTVRGHWTGNPTRGARLQLTGVTTIPQAAMPRINRAYREFPWP